MTHSLVLQVIEKLKTKHQTICLAESCTGGQLASVFTEVPGVSAVFKGSLVVYDNEWKQNFLGVNKETLKNFGAVSEECAVEMSAGARERGQADWCVSVTGIAGPSGGTSEKPVGTVCFGISGPKIEKTRQEHFLGDRKSVQSQSVELALRWILETI